MAQAPGLLGTILERYVHNGTLAWWQNEIRVACHRWNEIGLRTMSIEETRPHPGLLQELRDKLAAAERDLPFVTKRAEREYYEDKAKAAL